MKKKLHKVLVFGDNQVPYHDKKVWLSVLEFIKDFQPDTIIINGDFIDCYALSKFRRHPTIQRGLSFSEEVTIGKKILQELRKTARNAEIVYVWGNHDLRAEKYIAENAEEFVGLVSLEDLLCFKQLQIKSIKNDLNENFVDYKGKVLIGHFDRFSKIPGNTARCLVADYGKSIVQSHTHHAAVISRAFHDVEVFGIETGCLCDKQAVYKMHTDWTQGFVVLFFDHQNNWWFEQIFIKDGRFVFGGKLY